jgi:NADPH:quinone reductase-like Zn-dependent oxidoreductase
VDDYLAISPGGDGFDIIFDTVGGSTLDQSFRCVRPYVGHVVSILGWGTHSLAPLSLRGATYSGVFTLLPLLTGNGRAHHGEILSAAATLVDAGQLVCRCCATGSTSSALWPRPTAPWSPARPARWS